MVLGQIPVAEMQPIQLNPVSIPAKAIEREMDIMEEALQSAAPEVVEEKFSYLMPTLVEEIMVPQSPIIDMSDIREEEPVIIHFELQPEEEIKPQQVKIPGNVTNENTGIITVNKMLPLVKDDSINSAKQKESLIPGLKETDAELILSKKDSTSSTTPVSAASGGYLARPSNIYAESKPEANTSTTSAEKPVPSTTASNEQEELLELQMQIIERDDIPAADMPLAHQAQTPLFTQVEDTAMQDETEEQKRRAAERLHKLRNLSFNVNAADPNNEFETVPAYIRRNMELYNNPSVGAGNTQVENFYSSYEVKTDQNNQTQISTINTFLEGKKPD
jgi:cell division protein FtsZ